MRLSIVPVFKAPGDARTDLQEQMASSSEQNSARINTGKVKSEIFVLI